ncbi:hypothetical protein DMA11_02990 [Marinilabiliaceae bacterium JC017]|nr:hypothetical protein DMA11_02990 [Marinilabiliaceae bacterium JC017]
MDKTAYLQSKRDPSLDVLRGLMLIIIMINHVDGPLKQIFHQPIGFVSAAEGFVFLSGIVFGLVYGRIILSGKSKKTIQIKATKRAVVIYRYHLLILLFVLLPSFFLDFSFQPLHAFIETPVKSTAFYLLFMLQPENLDILPMYALFILFAPLVLMAYHKKKEWLVFVICFSLWLLAQYDWFSFLNLSTEQHGINLGFFNVFAWQALFYAGCYIGYMRAKGKVLFPKSQPLMILFLMGSVALIVVDYTDINWLLFRAIRGHASRPHLGIVRFGNFLMVAYLINCLIQNGKFFFSKPIATLGRYSIQVFSFQIIIIYYSGLFIDEILSFGPVATTAFQLLCILMLFILVFLYKKLVPKENSHRKAKMVRVKGNSFSTASD